MEQTNKPTTLKDVINYEAETYITEEDASLIRSTFRGNPRLLKALKKIFLPSIGDPDMPVEEFGKDMWLQGRDYAQIPDADIKTIVLGRQEAIKFICGALIQLNVIANSDIESPLTTAARRKQDSAK